MAVLDTFRLDGKKALVTGGNRGLGKAFARGLAEAGAQVAIVARDAEKNATTQAELAAEGHSVAVIAGDVTTEADAIITQAVEALGGLDILVNNAGVAIHVASFDCTDEQWDRTIDLNLNALWKTSVAAARHFKEQGGGTIVNIGSISAQIVNRPQWQAAYNASKAAVHQLTKSLAAEWAPYGIRVNAIAPGYVKTEMAPVDRPEFKVRWIDDSVQQRFALPEEIAPTVVYVASDATAFMTGSVVVIDGGYTVY